MEKKIHVTAHTLSPQQIEEIRNIVVAQGAPEETRKLAQALLDMNQSLHDVLHVLKVIAESGALQVKRT